jgi:hypothetical protein
MQEWHDWLFDADAQGISGAKQYATQQRHAAVLRAVYAYLLSIEYWWARQTFYVWVGMIARDCRVETVTLERVA